MKKSIITSLFFILVQTPIIAIGLFFLFNTFLNTCPNTEVLTWDADLRFVKTLHMMDNFRNLEPVSFLFQIVDSPTWPVLRNLIQGLLFFITGPSQKVDVYITFFTFILLIVLLSHILYYITQDLKFLAILFFISWSPLLLSPPILIYTFTAMLEIQGALFFVLTCYYLALFYKEENPASNKALLWKILLSSFALFSTKYPYGYMLLLSLFLFHTAFYFQETVLYFSRYIAYVFYKFKYKLHFHLIILLVLLFLFAPAHVLHGKVKSQMLYAAALIFCIDFFYYALKRGAEHLNLGFAKIHSLIIRVALPISAWVLIHPDRFTSSSSTVAHIQAEGHEVGKIVEKNLDYYLVFFKAISIDSFNPNYIGVLLFLGMMVSIAVGTVYFLRHKEVKPYLLISSQILISILFLTFLTPNHQARHIYHFLPALSLNFALLLWDLRNTNRLMGTVFIGVFAILFVLPLQSKFREKFAGEEVCYTGKNINDYKLPMWIDAEVKHLLKSNSIIINRIDPNHVNKADAELLISKAAYENRVKVFFDPKKFHKIQNDFTSCYVIGNQCSGEEAFKENSFFKHHPEFEHDSELKLKSDSGCIEIYRLRRL